MNQSIASPTKKKKVLEAFHFLDEVKEKLKDKPDVYTAFRTLMKDFKEQRISVADLMEKMKLILRGCDDVVQSFNAFVPKEYRIESPRHGTVTPSATNQTSFFTTDTAKVPSAPEKEPFVGLHWSQLSRVSHDEFQSQDEAIQIDKHIAMTTECNLPVPQSSSPDEDIHSFYYGDGDGESPTSMDLINEAPVSCDGSEVTSGHMTQNAEPKYVGTMPDVELVEPERLFEPSHENRLKSYFAFLNERFKYQPEKFASFVSIIRAHKESQRKVLLDMVDSLIALFTEDHKDLLSEFIQFLPAETHEEVRSSIDNSSNIHKKAGIMNEKNPTFMSPPIQQTVRFAQDVKPPLITDIGNKRPRTTQTSSYDMHAAFSPASQTLLGLPPLSGMIGGGYVGGVKSSGLSYLDHNNLYSYSSSCSSSMQSLPQMPQMVVPDPVIPVNVDETKKNKAFDFVFKLREAMSTQPGLYRSFLQVLREHRASAMPTAELLKRIQPMFSGHEEMMVEFTSFLPQYDQQLARGLLNY